MVAKSVNIHEAMDIHQMQFTSIPIFYQQEFIYIIWVFLPSTEL